MDAALYWLARALLALLQGLPLLVVARLGRLGGGLAYWLDRRHRRVAQRNLTLCFGQQKSSTEIRALARENFRRIGENFACAVKTAAMSFEELRPHVEFVGDPRILAPASGQLPESIVVAIGHFGNFELYARFNQFAPAYRCATTYRALRQPALNKLMQEMRERSGCLYFERRFDGHALRGFMNQRGVMLGLLSDQSSGNLRVPFLGHDCSTSAAPAVFALRYRCALHTGVCYRVGLARWRIEAGEEIPTHENGQARSMAAIMADVNRAFEAAVRRDPANWFWVHKRWKPAPPPRNRAGVHSEGSGAADKPVRSPTETPDEQAIREEG
ncbi:Lipid A biosynthesis acyltransferase [Verrucomicrobia bacterium]|nr:Lipid A biosynthesis acyltransferase [Verrucomicrobiota bacterium]